MISKTKIEKGLKKKTDLYLVETIIKLKKTRPEVAKALAMPRSRWKYINLEDIDKKTKTGEKILVIGKVLGDGDLSKKIKIVAWNISKKAMEKIKKSKSEAVLIFDEIKKNPELKELKIF